jgi:hypothetical protein
MIAGLRRPHHVTGIVQANRPDFVAEHHRRSSLNCIGAPLSRMWLSVGAAGGASTCGAVMVLFVGNPLDVTIASPLFALFGLAVTCALGAIIVYTAEMLLVATGIRAEAAQAPRAVSEDDLSDARGTAGRSGDT